MTVRTLALAIALIWSNAATAARPQPMAETPLPLDRALSMALVIHPDLVVLQEDDLQRFRLSSTQSMTAGAMIGMVGSPAVASWVTSVTPGKFLWSASQDMAVGAALGVATSVITEGVAAVKRRNDRKRLELIQKAVGTTAWGERLENAVRSGLSSEGLGPGFAFLDEVPRKRVGAWTFDAPGRALGTLQGYVAFTPNLRGIRIALAATVEDRRVIRDTQLRLRLERLPLRQVAVEYLIALPDDAELNQSERSQRWAEQTPEAFAAAIQTGIDETLRLANQHWRDPSLRVTFEEPVSFRADTRINGTGRVLERQDDRVLIEDRYGGLHSVPVGLLEP